MGYSFHYKADYEERIDLRFLLDSSPDEVVRWLRKQFKEPEKGIYGETLHLYEDKGRRLLEYLLIKRKNLLIDHALARYGYSSHAIQTAYDRGDTSTRLAALGNIRGGMALHQSLSIILSGKFHELKALLNNRWLSGEILGNILSRKERFSVIPDDRFKLIVRALSGNKRLSEPYNAIMMDGYDEYSYHKVFYTAWQLAELVPNDQSWAGVLWNFLSNTIKPPAFENLDATISRWNIDITPDTEGKWWSRSPSFHVRSLLYDFKKPDDSLSVCEDLAGRCSFYRRFSPHNFRGWPHFLEVDGEEFTHSVLQNENIWRYEDQRDLLSQVCWSTPDERSNMDMPNEYNKLERLHNTIHPEWFGKKNEKSNISFENIIDRLESIETEIRSKDKKKGFLNF